VRLGILDVASNNPGTVLVGRRRAGRTPVPGSRQALDFTAAAPVAMTTP